MSKLGKLTWRSAMRVLIWCVVLYVLVVAGAVGVGVVSGLVAGSAPPKPVTLVYVNRPAPSAVPSAPR